MKYKTPTSVLSQDGDGRQSYRRCLVPQDARRLVRVRLVNGLAAARHSAY